MAVYTSVSRAEVADLARLYQQGCLRSYAGIEGGVENSNYLLHCENTDLVLTLFEAHDAAQLPYFHRLLNLYQQAAIPVAAPLHTPTGETLITLQGKAAALFPLLPGQHVATATTGHCRAIGAVLARMHLAAANYPARPAWDLDNAALHDLGQRLLTHLPHHERSQLQSALGRIDSLDYAELPTGTIHGDLFRDNVLFDGATISGILDPYTAHSGPLLYDLAVAATDWCITAEAQFDPARMAALLSGYNALRPLSAAETASWNAMLSSATLRFWLSRLRDWHFPRSGELIRPKDPGLFARLHHAAGARPQTPFRSVQRQAHGGHG